MIHFNSNRNSLSPEKHKSIGNLGETLALKFLTDKGFRLVKRNYRIKNGELDLIMENDDIMIFVEVKTRNSAAFGEPEDALTTVQTKRIIRAILHYLDENEVSKKWRCDLIGIKFTSPNNARIKHLNNILLN